MLFLSVQSIDLIQLVIIEGKQCLTRAQGISTTEKVFGKIICMFHRCCY